MVDRSSPAITPDFFVPSMRIALICFRLVSRVSGKPEQRIVANSTNSLEYSGEWRRILENRSKQDRHRNIVELAFPAKKHRPLSGQKVFLNIISPVFSHYLELFATIRYSGFPDTPRFPLFDLIHCEA